MIDRERIEKFVDEVARQFQPERVVLFGSYAYGRPHADSDVDLLVVMPAGNQHSQAVRILYRLSAPFPLDLIVHTPKEMAWRLKEKESFLTTIVTRGKVLYEKNDKRMGQESGAGLHHRKSSKPKRRSALWANATWNAFSLQLCR